MSYRKFVKAIVRQGLDSAGMPDDVLLFKAAIQRLLNIRYVEYAFPKQTLNIPLDVIRGTVSAIREGYINLPNPHVYFEVPTDNYDYNILASQKDPRIEFRVFISEAGQRPLYPAVVFNLDTNNPDNVHTAPEYGCSERAISPDFGQSDIHKIMYAFFGCLTLLSTKGVTLKTSRRSPRTIRGKTMTAICGSVQHTVVLGVANADGDTVPTSDGTKQKWHIRRGHIRFRNHPTKKPVWVKPYAAGDMSLGFVEKDYQVKDMGEILYKNNINFSK